jgi:signal transduction histidine kinase
MIGGGIRMAEEELPRLFQKFSQLHTDAKHQGSGLGLAICRA